MAEKAERAQNAAENERSKQLYDIIKQLTGQNNRQAAAVKNKDGELLKNKEERLARWKEHFGEVLNRDTPESPPEDENLEVEELDISVEAPTLEKNQSSNESPQERERTRSRPDHSRDAKSRPRADQ